MMENQQIGKVHLDLSLYNPEEIYTDGEIEDRLLEIVKNGQPIDDVLNHTTSWPVLYHLSSMRENILSWYPIRENTIALEVGAGCGAVTGALTAKCARVDAIDLSLKRSQINAWRHREDDNLNIIVGNFQKFAESCTLRYDYITLIGVFEYAASYIGTAEPYSNMLKIADQLLKPNGRILIAIENRFGAKYFAGCAEDHLGTYFSGVCGYTQDSKVRTFNRKEWKNLLEQSGHHNYQFFYPYPDYKFPVAIYSDERLPKRGELNRNLGNYDRDRLNLFDEMSFWDSIADTDYFKDFSNSFFLDILRKDE